ncbi:unnamed protein product [Protopolystoma xenopodis]|uniref:Polyprenyl synthetase n=1 Tax=Protopolystoma xenopodis TaxID=117903 RepID=A0A3S5CF05_9PLAT|nr:unnamed protein product [Protopolystoma xenopodis]
MLRVLHSHSSRATDISRYYFQAKGKMLRPLMVVLMAASVNHHAQGINSRHILLENSRSNYERSLAYCVSNEQHTIAIVTEMIHTASLMHDDLLDSAFLRRGNETAYRLFGCSCWGFHPHEIIATFGKIRV